MCQGWTQGWTSATTASVVLPCSSSCDRYFDVRWIDISTQCRGELVAVELAFPPSHHDRGHTIAGEIHKGSAFAHELVDAEQDGHARHQRWVNGRQRRRERDEARARDT